MAGAPFEPALHDGAVVRLLLAASASGSGSPPVDRPSRTRLSPASVEQRAERLALAQFAFRQPVRAHDDLVAGAELSCR